MFDDYTLIIPTYNRSSLLATLLDSSTAAHRTRNKALRSVLSFWPLFKKPGINEETSWPKTIRTPARTYRMHKNFLDFESKGMILNGPDDINRLLASLDCYADGS